MKNLLNHVFSDAKLRAFAVRYREVLGLLAAVLLVWALGVNKNDFAAAFVVAMIGEFIQLWCFASLDKNSSLAFRGPYAFVRNPMYLGRYFLVLGVLLLLNYWQPVVIVVYTLLYWFYMYHRVQREEALLKQVFGQDYADYCDDVRPFLPRLTPYKNSTVLFWSWKLLRQNNGPANLAATLIGFAIVYGLLQRFG